MTYRYEIDADNAVKIFSGNETAPFLFQPSWPDNTPWASKAEAETWAQQYIAMVEDKTNGRPGPSPEQPFIPYVPEPVVEESVE